MPKINPESKHIKLKKKAILKLLPPDANFGAKPFANVRTDIKINMTIEITVRF